MAYSKGFVFDKANLEKNIAEFDLECRQFLELDLKAHEIAGEESMKTRAPWKDRTHHARNTLWASSEFLDDSINLRMGHGAEYGIYLEESNGGKYQIVMPILLETARSFMRSLERMFLQIQTKQRPVPVITPTGTRPGTSQGVKERFLGADSRPNMDARGNVHDTKGKFADQGKGYSRVAKAAKSAARALAEAARKAEERRLRRNEQARARYAARKASGTSKTKRTRRG